MFLGHLTTYYVIFQLTAVKVLQLTVNLQYDHVTELLFVALLLLASDRGR
jgi:hypothetical protein